MIDHREFFVELDFTIEMPLIERMREILDTISFIRTKYECSVQFSNILEPDQQIKFGNKLDDYFASRNSLQMFLIIQPYSYLPWHFDPSKERTTVINIPLYEYDDSHQTYFSGAPTREELGYDLYKIVQLKYKFAHPYMLNSKAKLHCVFNPTDIPRKIFSICTETSYKDAVAWFGDLAL